MQDVTPSIFPRALTTLFRVTEFFVKDQKNWLTNIQPYFVRLIFWGWDKGKSACQNQKHLTKKNNKFEIIFCTSLIYFLWAG